MPVPRGARYWRVTFLRHCRPQRLGAVLLFQDISMPRHASFSGVIYAIVLYRRHTKITARHDAMPHAAAHIAGHKASSLRGRISRFSMLEY